MYRLTIIGAGKLGQALGRLLSALDNVQIHQILNRSQQSAEYAAQIIGSGSGISRFDAITPADIFLISTPDDAIATTCKHLVNAHVLQPHTIIFHCSGSLTAADTCAHTTSTHRHIASIHPMTSFAHSSNMNQYPGTYCAMEGDTHALSVLEPLFSAIGSIPFRIKSETKALYHAAGVIASNYLVTLTTFAMDCLQQSGVDSAIQKPCLLHLMKNTLANLEKAETPTHALTGPIQRGDINTIKKHLLMLDDTTQQNAYQALGALTLKLCNANNDASNILSALLKQAQTHEK